MPLLCTDHIGIGALDFVGQRLSRHGQESGHLESKGANDGELKEYVRCKVDIDKKEWSVTLTQPVILQSFKDEFELPEGAYPRTPAVAGGTTDFLAFQQIVRRQFAVWISHSRGAQQNYVDYHQIARTATWQLHFS
jgi:hypothetical protein